ncbi:MAG: hypothetical protein ACKPKO_03940, partial [Candidatus Fonsibacter sp.]
CSSKPSRRPRKTAAAEALYYDWTSQTASPSVAAPTSVAPLIAKETPVSGSPSKPMTPGLQEAVTCSLQYGQTGTSSIRVCVGKTILKVIKDRLRWRPYPKKKGTVADESGDLYTMEKFREYARDGYAPFYLKKGLVEPWSPSGRWECPPYSAIKDSPESELIIWLAKQVDEIEWYEQNVDCERRVEPISGQDSR